MFRQRKIPPVSTWCMVEGVEQDVMVELDYSPAEPDVNAGENVEVTAIWFEDEGNIIDKLSNDEFYELENRMYEVVINNAADEIDERGDWEYEQRKDRMLEERE